MYNQKMNQLIYILFLLFLNIPQKVYSAGGSPPSVKVGWSWVSITTPHSSLRPSATLSGYSDLDSNISQSLSILTDDAQGLQCFEMAKSAAASGRRFVVIASSADQTITLADQSSISGRRVYSCTNSPSLFRVDRILKPSVKQYTSCKRERMNFFCFNSKPVPTDFAQDGTVVGYTYSSMAQVTIKGQPTTEEYTAAVEKCKSHTALGIASFGCGTSPSKWLECVEAYKQKTDKLSEFYREQLQEYMAHYYRGLPSIADGISIEDKHNFSQPDIEKGTMFHTVESKILEETEMIWLGDSRYSPQYLLTKVDPCRPSVDTLENRNIQTKLHGKSEGLVYEDSLNPYYAADKSPLKGVVNIAQVRHKYFEKMSDPWEVASANTYKYCLDPKGTDSPWVADEWKDISAYANIEGEPLKHKYCSTWTSPLGATRYSITKDLARVDGRAGFLRGLGPQGLSPAQRPVLLDLKFPVLQVLE